MKKIIYKNGCGVKIDLTGEILANVSEVLNMPCVIEANCGYYSFMCINNSQKISYFSTNKKGELYAYMCGIINAESIKKLLNK